VISQKYTTYSNYILNEDSLHKKIIKLEAKNIGLKNKIEIFEKFNNHKTFKAKLHYEYRQKKLLVDISKLLNNYKNFRKALDKIVKLIGEHTKVSRVYIFEDFDNGKYCRSSHEWCNTGISSEKDKLQKIDYSEIPSFKPLIREKGVLNIYDVDDLPVDLQDVLKPQEVKASLLIPMYVNEEYFGNMGFDDCITDKKWKKHEINFLKIIVNLISTAFEKEIFISKLIYSSNRFKAFSRATFESIFICDNGKIIDLNYKARQLTKFDRNELLSKNIIELISKNEREYFLHVLNSSKEQINEFTLIKKDKTKLEVETETKFFLYKKKRVQVVAVRDISERKKAEALIKENQDKYRAIIETAKDAIFIFEKETGIIHDINKNAENLLKLQKKDLLGKNRSKIHPKDELDNNSGKFVDINYWINNIVRSSVINKDGDIIPVEISSNKIIINKKELIIGFYRDVTLQINYEKILLNAKEKAEESEMLKSAFLSNISHEIRTPLNGIIGFTNLLKTSDFDEDKRNRFLEIIENSGNQLLNLISDIIDLSKFESGIIKLNNEKVYINKLIVELHEFFDLGILSKENKQIQFLYETEFSNKNMFIYSDYVRLKQIFVNLIGNALKFTNKGYVKFGYKFKEYNNNKFIEFFVKDTGIGISENKQKVIFQRFRQAEESTSKTYGGTGLGLNISKILVKKLGGNIWVESIENKGSTFYFTIPFIENNEIKKTKNINFKGKTILIIDSEKDNSEEIKEILKESKIESFFAFSVEDALIIIKAIAKIDIVLINDDMENDQELTISQKIKNIRQSLPIIQQCDFNTGLKSETNKLNSINAKIGKPINSKELVITIDKLLNNNTEN